MKKLFFIMAMSVCAFTAQAQTTSGIRVGLNMTSATGKYNDLMADQDYNNKGYMGYSIHYFYRCSCDWKLQYSACCWTFYERYHL